MMTPWGSKHVATIKSTRVRCFNVLHFTYVGGPKNNENFFYGGERGGTSVCSRLVRVRDCPPHQLAKRRP